MSSFLNKYGFVAVAFFIAGCGGGSSSDDTTPSLPPPPAPTPDPIVSFAVADAPADSVTSVNVTIASILLKSASDDDDDDSGLSIPLTDSNGNAATMTINLMDYQDGESKLIIENASIPVGEYKSLVLNTEGCAQNPNGSAEFCWVDDIEGRKPLKTPSNKLRLGAVTITADSEQAFVIEFNLRSSLVSTGNGRSYNLKPHGVNIVANGDVGKLMGMVDANLLTAGNGCETVFEPETDHGKIVYLYEGDLASSFMADEFDPDVAQNTIPEGMVKPYRSDALVQDSETAEYRYGFAHLPAGMYTVAFSCSAVGDDSEEFDSVVIPNPELQRHVVTIVASEDLVQDFTEN